MYFNKDKELVLRYLSLPIADRLLIEKSLPTAVTEKLTTAIAELEDNGIDVESLNKVGYSTFMRELKIDDHHSSVQNKILSLIESKSAELNKAVPKKLVTAINSFLG